MSTVPPCCGSPTVRACLGNEDQEERTVDQQGLLSTCPTTLVRNDALKSYSHYLSAYGPARQQARSYSRKSGVHRMCLGAGRPGFAILPSLLTSQEILRCHQVLVPCQSCACLPSKLWIIIVGPGLRRKGFGTQLYRFLVMYRNIT